MAKIISIIAPQGFQDIEYNDSKHALESAGHEVVTASTKHTAFGKFGAEEKVDLLIDEVKVGDYDAIVFIGGPGVYELFEDKTALKLAKDFYNAGKLTTAICAAPSILANAGLLKAKRVTCFSSQEDHLKEKEAICTGFHVEQDGLIITADGPDSATGFGKKIAEELEKKG